MIDALFSLAVNCDRSSTNAMRRAQSVRYNRPSSIALSTDDLGVLREDDESNEDVLRRQLLDKDRENDRLQTQIETLQAQLAQRPPLETIQELEKEYKHLELLLQGTQRENERCMTEMERCVLDYLQLSQRTAHARCMGILEERAAKRCLRENSLGLQAKIGR